MIVEDDATFRRVLESLFSDDWEVRAMSDAESALREIGGFAPDLVLADFRLPGMDGAELAMAVHRNPATATTPVIVLSGVAGKEDRQRVFQSGALDFLEKPVAADELKMRAAAIAATASFHRRAAHEAQQRLRDTQARFEAAFRAARVGLEITDPAGVIVEVNERYCEIVGRSREELVGQRAAPRLPGEGLQGLDRPDGSVARVRVTSGSAQRSDGSTEQVSVFEDLTEHHRARQALVASEETLRRVAASLRDRVVIMLDAGGRMTGWSEIAEGLIGYPPEQVLGRHVSSIYLAGDPEAAVRALGKAAVAGTVFEQGWCRRSDGSRFWADVAVVPLFAESEGLTGYAFVVRDLSERKRMEEEREVLLQEARAATKARDQFLATLSHELRTPLNAIMGWAHLLKNGDLDEAGRMRAAEVIARNAGAQARIVGEVLELSALMSGRVRTRNEEVNLPELLAELVDEARPLASRKNIAVTLSVESAETSSLLGDRHRLKTMFGSLLDNAVKFTGRDGAVRMDARRDGNFTRVSVIDNGPGFPPDFLPRMFLPFEQADGSSTRHHAGLGLGLAIVKQIVDLHRGTVEVTNGQPGGARVTVSLPIGPLSASSEIAELSNLRLAGLRIGIVEDHDDSRDFLVSLLRQEGAEVLSARSADEALTVFAPSHPDVLLSDIGLPGRSGVDFIRELRAGGDRRLAAVPAVALTAWDRPADRESARAAGFDAHLGKPVDGEALIRIVLRLVERPTA
jgi:PAS domain S-box-containing protein